MIYLEAQWPAPARVRTCLTTRDGGVSCGAWQGLNLGDHVGDDPQHVRENRQRLREHLGLASEPVWLRQVHGNAVLALTPGADPAQDRDGSVAGRGDGVCAVLTADCLPILLCNRQGTRVGALHGGWRGLAAGIIESGVAALQADPGDILAWLGPAIGPTAFEVGEEVRTAFVDDDPAAARAFTPGEPGKWLADIWLLARLRLQRLGVTGVYGGGLCTVTDAQRFYSFRRDRTTGRMASLIWLETESET